MVCGTLLWPNLPAERRLETESSNHSLSGVFRYSTSREFLDFAFAQSKKSYPGMTISKFSKKLNIGCSSLKMILSGHRPMTLAQFHSIGKRLKLSSSEFGYLESLLLKEKAQTPQTKKYYDQRAKSARKNHRLQSIYIPGGEALTDPYIIPILVYLTEIDAPKTSEKSLSHFDSPNLVTEISKYFSISIERAKNALGILEKLKLRSLNEGVPPGTALHYIVDQLLLSYSHKKYLKAWLQEASLRMDVNFEFPYTIYTATTIGLSNSEMINLKHDFKSLLERYLSLSSKKIPRNGEIELVQICVQMFPIQSK